MDRLCSTTCMQCRRCLVPLAHHGPFACMQQPDANAAAPLGLLRAPNPTDPTTASPLRSCILAKIYNGAADVIADDIYDVDPQRTATTPTDFYLYCYYGGIVAAGRKQYGRALELLTHALTAPAVASSAIAVAAYKKAALISLVHCGAQLPGGGGPLAGVARRMA
eukprot:353707-Chlamydomonas_euryale.AAC.5